MVGESGRAYEVGLERVALGKHAGLSDTSLPGMPLLQSQEKDKCASAADVARLLDTRCHACP